MTLPSPTTSHHQTTLPFSTTSTSTLSKSFSQSDYHHEFRFINCLKQGKSKPNTSLDVYLFHDFFLAFAYIFHRYPEPKFNILSSVFVTFALAI